MIFATSSYEVSEPATYDPAQCWIGPALKLTGSERTNMRIKSLMLTAGFLAAGIAATSVGANAQGPMYDKVLVDLPYSVTINNTTLQPGHYVIRQMDDMGTNSRVLMIFGDNGMKLKATAITIAALDNNTPE